MPNPKNQILLEEIIGELDNELSLLREETLKRASSILNRDINIQSLHGIIGGKNNTYVDSVHSQFIDFNDFFSQWLKGLNDTFEKDKFTYLRYNNEFDWHAKSIFRNVRLLQDEKIYQYTCKFLERNFYKNLNARIRSKPDENLWEIWFGFKLTYGLLIAPERIDSGWRIDKSEIRRANYNYWTIGHILNTGIIDPYLNKPIYFKGLEDFCLFYLSVLKRLSNSNYEKEICDHYISYINESEDPFNEPLLIPEFRYAGLEKEHKFRLDFTVLNSHTNEFIGFEISPASTHMQVTNLKSKQVEVNIELKEKWAKEMIKRNSYFDSFGITTKTFTDNELKDLDNCFSQIKKILEKRPDDKTTIDYQKIRLNGQ